jgi:hypothetical protein
VIRRIETSNLQKNVRMAYNWNTWTPFYT